VSQVVLLDTSPLSLLSNPNHQPQVAACRSLAASLRSAGHRIIVPEITDYEVRRELIRAGKIRSLLQHNAPKQSTESDDEERFCQFITPPSPHTAVDSSKPESAPMLPGATRTSRPSTLPCREGLLGFAPYRHPGHVCIVAAHAGFLHSPGRGISQDRAAIGFFETIDGRFRVLAELTKGIPLKLVSRNAVRSWAKRDIVVEPNLHAGLASFVHALAKFDRQRRRQRDGPGSVEVVVRHGNAANSVGDFRCVDRIHLMQHFRLLSGTFQRGCTNQVFGEARQSPNAESRTDRDGDEQTRGNGIAAAPAPGPLAPAGWPGSNQAAKEEPKRNSASPESPRRIRFWMQASPRPAANECSSVDAASGSGRNSKIAPGRLSGRRPSMVELPTRWPLNSP